MREDRRAGVAPPLFAVFTGLRGQADTFCAIINFSYKFCARHKALARPGQGGIQDDNLMAMYYPAGHFPVEQEIPLNHRRRLAGFGPFLRNSKFLVRYSAVQAGPCRQQLIFV
jgi:hypothetical protein